MINLKRDREPLEPVKKEEEPVTAPRSKKKRLLILALALLIIWKGAMTWRESRMWRAVFLTNNQVYFGRFVDWPIGDSITLTDIHSLELGQNIQPQGAGGASEFKVVKLGGEIHSPEDMMVIPKKNILFWENLKKEGNLVRTIESAH
jgi:hypothetical protein